MLGNLRLTANGGELIRPAQQRDRPIDVAKVDVAIGVDVGRIDVAARVPLQVRAPVGERQHDQVRDQLQGAAEAKTDDARGGGARRGCEAGAGGEEGGIRRARDCKRLCGLCARAGQRDKWRWPARCVLSGGGGAGALVACPARNATSLHGPLLQCLRGASGTRPRIGDGA